MAQKYGSMPESSVTFPTAFPGKTREIKITGEVYVEVAADKKKTFQGFI